MNKILFIGHYKENTGWGLASRNYLKALLATKLNVVARPILLNQSNFPVDEEISKAEENDISGCDICIQHVQPHYYDFNGRFKKNIGILIQESIGLKNTGWDSYINRMDEIWVPNTDAQRHNTAELRSTPFKVVPHAFDHRKYVHYVDNAVKYKRFPELAIDELNGKFVFYTIGEFNRRKRLGLLIEAFNLAFTKNDPVALLIKANSPGKNRQQLFEDITNHCQQIKHGLKLYPKIEQYPTETIITDNLSSNEIMGIHQRCDCFVLPSFGEAWSIPTFEAAVMGKHVIYNNFLGPKEYLTKSPHPHRGLNGTLTTPIGVNDTQTNIHTAREHWMSISVNQLVEAMRFTFEDTGPKALQDFGIKLLADYSYESVGKIMLENLKC